MSVAGSGENLVEESRCWWLRDQSDLASGLVNWVDTWDPTAAIGGLGPEFVPGPPVTSASVPGPWGDSMAAPNGQSLSTRPFVAIRDTDTGIPIPHSEYESDYFINERATEVANSIHGLPRSAGKRSHGDLDAMSFNQ